MSILRREPRSMGLEDWFEDEFGSRTPSPGGQRSLAMDVYETDKNVVVKLDAPGFKPEDVDVSVRGNMLVVRGTMESEQEANEENYYRRERRYGSFRRAITLPTTVNADQAQAMLQDGTLTIELPKSAETRQQAVPVRGQGGQAQRITARDASREQTEGEQTGAAKMGQGGQPQATMRPDLSAALPPGEKRAGGTGPTGRKQQGASRTGDPDISEPPGGEPPGLPETQGRPSMTVLDGEVHPEPEAQETGEPRLEGSGQVVGNAPQEQVQLDVAEATDEGHAQPGEVGPHVKEESGSSIGENTTPIWFEERTGEDKGSEGGAQGAWSETMEEDEAVDQEMDDYRARRPRDIPNPRPSGRGGDPEVAHKSSASFARRTGEGTNVPGARNPRVDEGLNEDITNMLGGGPEDADLSGEEDAEFGRFDDVSDYDAEDTRRRVRASRRRMEQDLTGNLLGHSEPSSPDEDELEEDELEERIEFEDEAEDEWNFEELDEELEDDMSDEDD